jgi:hypothetical protein
VQTTPSLVIRNYGSSFELTTLDNSVIQKVNVYNTLGNRVYTSENYTYNRISVNAPGVYIVEAYTTAGVVKEKLVIR